MTKDGFKLRGKIKKFNQTLFDKYDTPARELVKKLLGDVVSDNPDIYAEDMLINEPKCKYKFIELQVCAEWFSEKYPYSRPFVYERKGSFSDDTLFFIFNKEMTRVLIFGRKYLLPEPKRIKKFSRTFVYEVMWNNVLNTLPEFITLDLLMDY